MNINQQEVAALERQVGDQGSSPLFAKLAHLYLESGRAKDALRICDAGLANFPFYSTGHLIKGKALLHLGLNGEARREFEFVHSWLPFNASVSDLLNAVPVSDDQVLEAPPSEEPSDAQFGGGSGSDAGEATLLNASAQADGGDIYAQADGMDAFAQAEQSVAVVEDEFEVYAMRKRDELGPTNGMSLEDFLSSEAPEASSPHPSEMGQEGNDFGGEDAFAAAGFSTTVETTVEEQSSGEEPHPPEFAGLGGTEPSMEAEPEIFSAVDDAQPAGTDIPEFGGFGETEATTGFEQEAAPASDTPAPADDEGSSGFAGFGESDVAVETAAGGSETQDSSGLDAFGISADVPSPVNTPPVDEQSASEETPAVETQEQDIFAGFVGPGEENASEASEESAPAEPDTEEQSAFPDFSGLPGFDEPAAGDQAVETEPDGEGFSGPPAGEPEAPRTEGDKIGEFAEKLQGAKKITPVIDLSSRSSSSPSSADEAAADAGFVTPTLAEIYAKQGWYDDAINAYKTLAMSRPAEKDKFEQRVKELEEEKAKAE